MAKFQQFVLSLALVASLLTQCVARQARPVSTAPMTPTRLLSATATAPATPSVVPSPSLVPYQVLYSVSSTTTYTLTAQDSSAARDLLAGLGIPAGEQGMNIGLGGLPISATLPLLAEINDLAGAVYDPESGRLLLLGTHDPALPEIEPDDLVVALRSAYSEADDVGVSIDPIDPGDLGGPMQVSYYGQTQDTHVGQVMYEADRYLKILSMGEDNITGQAVTCTVPGYRSEADLALEFPDQDQAQQWHRMWYLVAGQALPISVNTDNSAMMFGEVPIIVQARYVQFDQQGQKHDVPGSSPSIDAFVGHYNSHFAQFAAEKREVGQLVQLAKLLSIARWLRGKQVPVDLDWLASYPLKAASTPATTPGRTVTRSHTETEGNRTLIRQVMLFGGVDMGFKNELMIPPPGDPVHQVSEIAGQVPLDQVRSTTPVNIGSQKYRAAPVFVTQAGVPGRLILAQPLFLAPVAGLLVAGLTLYYDSYSRQNSPVAPGWSLGLSRLSPSEPIAAKVEGTGQDVQIPRVVTLVDPSTGSRRSYRNSGTIVDGELLYDPEDQKEAAQLRYDYQGRSFRLDEGGIRSRFDGGGLLIAQTRGDERLEIRYDATGNPIALAHSDGTEVQLRYDQGLLVEAIGPGNAKASLVRQDADLVRITRADGVTTISHVDGRPHEIRNGSEVLSVDFDALGRVLQLEHGGLIHTLDYTSDSSIQSIEGVPGHLITVERGPKGQIVRVEVTEDVNTNDIHLARAAVDPATLEPGSLLQAMLDNPHLDLSPLLAGHCQKMIIQPLGKRTVRIEGSILVVDGRLMPTQLAKALDTGWGALEQLREQGYVNLTLDPDSGVVAGFDPQTRETMALVPQEGGVVVRRSFPRLRGEVDDIARLVTDLGGQSRGLRVSAWFQTPEGGWNWLTPAGEVKLFLVGQERTLGDLNGAAGSLGGQDQAGQFATQLGDALRQDMAGAWAIDWPSGDASTPAELLLQAYPCAERLLQGDDLETAAKQLPPQIQPGQVVRLKPIETLYGWLLPGKGPLFVDVPQKESPWVSRFFGANDLRLIAPHSTPQRAEAYLERERPIMGKDIVVLYTPDGKAEPEQAKAQRDAFRQVQQRLQGLGIRVEDIGENREGDAILLSQLTSEDMVVLEVTHLGGDNRLQIYGDGSVHPKDFRKVRGVKYFMACSSMPYGVPGAAVRAGADSAVGTVAPITTDQVNAWLEHMVDYLQQHPEGVLPSKMEQDLRIQMLIEYGDPGYGPATLPMSHDPNGDMHIA